MAQLDDQHAAQCRQVDGVFEHDANNSKISQLPQWAREIQDGRKCFWQNRCRSFRCLFRAMDLFVMPSGLSLAMLSAMAAGLPVVAISVGGVRQVLGDDEYGFTVPAGDTAALVSRIEACFANPENNGADERKRATARTRKLQRRGDGKALGSGVCVGSEEVEGLIPSSLLLFNVRTHANSRQITLA
ncbi:MAG: glycosyltransferase [Sulfuricella sp.]